MRTFKETHPWLRFSVDLTPMPPDFWMALGEAKSKCEHMAQVPLRDDVADTLYRLYLAKGVHATTAIEGNTLSEQQVLDEIQGELKVPDSQEYQRQEVSNIIDACNAIHASVFSGASVDGLLQYEDILKYNRLVLEGLELDKGVVPGQIRKHPVVVGNVYKGPPADECEYLLRQMCDWLNDRIFLSLHERYNIGGALLRATLAHLYIAWIHPFGDGNGRTARLIEYQLLVASGVPSPSAHLLSNHYNLTRDKYYRELREASRNGGDPTSFLCYGVEGFVDGLREQVRYVLVSYLQDLVWRDFVDQQLHEQSESVGARQKELLVALFREEKPVVRPMLRGLSPRLAELYGDKTSKTLSRDINWLRERGLIVQQGSGWAANRRLIMQFLPPISELPALPAPDNQLAAAVE